MLYLGFYYFFLLKKGRHLSIRRSKRPNVISSCESDTSSSGEGAIDRGPYNDLSGNRISRMSSPSISTCGSIEQQNSLTRKKIYLSEECIYCGKFRTITRTKPHPLSASKSSDAWQDVGVNYTSCQCNELNFGAMIRSRDVTIESDDELVTSSSDSQPHALRYYCKYPAISLPTMVKIPVGQQMFGVSSQQMINGSSQQLVGDSFQQTVSGSSQQMINGSSQQTINAGSKKTISGCSQQMISGSDNQQQVYMLHDVYVKSDIVKQQHANYANQTSLQEYMQPSCRKFETQTETPDILPQSAPTTGMISPATYTGELTERINPRERSNSEPVPFTAIATLQSQLEFGGKLTKQMILEEQNILANASVDSPKDTIGDIFSKQFSEEQHKGKNEMNLPPKLPPRNFQKNSTHTQQKGSSPRKIKSEAVFTFPGESHFQLLCSVLKDVPGWWPGETEATVENSMSFVCKEDGHYMIWYMRSKDTLVLSVSHLSKIIHYAFYTSQDENGEIWYYIFPSKSFRNLKDLINHHIENGLDPQAQQPQPVPDSSDGGSFISQQNVRQSRRLVRMLHVRLRYPITEKHSLKYR
ncbi:hypothetical protein KUTeg_020976 [Tegillarca granosa]|uniref:SH2 domain-containing protein n=1 Tax=Tegillarca granosa TaxID=220873 RepID=A0ABQ9E9G5_TEGGR|nr:hypothetical protein KUTeg_020976 [Tegillarca granosa]